MKLSETTGLITKEAKYGDYQRIVTIITPDKGKISAITGRVGKRKKGISSFLQLFSFCKLVLFRNGDKGLYHINEADIIESFSNVRENLDAIIYASYFCDIANKTIVEDEGNPDFLRLLLNVFFAMTKGKDFDKIKTVFEWKAAMIEGYAPRTDGCVLCGSKTVSFFDLARGECFCEKCGKEYGGAVRIGEDIVKAVSYIRKADFSKMLSFDMKRQAIEYLNLLSEAYIKIHFEKEFKTLDYLKKMK